MHIKTIFFQYYAMKSKNLELLIIDLNNIHGYNRLKYTLWILSKNTSVFGWHILPCLCPTFRNPQSYHELILSKFRNFSNDLGLRLHN